MRKLVRRIAQKGGNLIKPPAGFSPIFSEATKESLTTSWTQGGIELVFETPQIPNFVAIDVQIKAGAVNESPELLGFFDFLEQCVTGSLSRFPNAFGSTKIERKKTHFDLLAACMGHQTEEFLQSFAAAISPNCLAQSVLDSLEKQDFASLEEEVEAVAFGRRGLGNFSSPSLDNARSEGFLDRAKNFYTRVLRPENLRIYASGVYNKEEFVLLVEKHFNFSAPAGTPTGLPEVQNQYVGGVLQRPRQTDPRKKVLFEQEEMFHEEMAIVFKTDGYSDPNFINFLLLEFLLGDFSHFSSGGPGKGTESRLKKRFNSVSAVTKFSHFHRYYENDGLFGILIKGLKNSGKALLNTLILEVEDLKAPVSRAELDYARNILFSNYFLEREGQFARMKKLKDEYFYTRNPLKEEDFIQNLNAITVEDVNKSLKKLLASSVTAVSLGDFYDFSRLVKSHFTR